MVSDINKKVIIVAIRHTSLAIQTAGAAPCIATNVGIKNTPRAAPIREISAVKPEPEQLK